MNLERIKMWEDDLRNGGHKQARNFLATENGYCCLGRVCVLAGIEPTIKANGAFAFNEKVKFLPWDAREWLGAKESDVRLSIPLHLREKAKDLHISCFESFAASLNDKGFTFVDIADCIRCTWPEAFVNFNKE